MSDNTPSKFKTKTWVELNDESHGPYRTGSQIKFKTSMIRSSLCDYSDPYIFVKGTITVTNTGTAAATNNRNKNVDIDVVMPMYDLIEYSDSYSKTSGSLWQSYRNKPFINNNGVIIDVPDDPDSVSFKYKQKLTDQIGNNVRKDIQIMIPLEYLSNFWRTLEIPLISCKVNAFFNLV